MVAYMALATARKQIAGADLFVPGRQGLIPDVPALAPTRLKRAKAADINLSSAMFTKALFNHNQHAPTAAMRGMLLRHRLCVDSKPVSYHPHCSQLQYDLE